MKYSQSLGMLSCLLIIIFSFVPWVYIESINKTITGMHTDGTNFGKPALMNIFFAGISFLLFIIPRLWAKRLNVFIAALNMAWTIRNFFVVSSCFAGDCPQKKWGFFIIIFSSIALLVMALLPRNIEY